MANELVKLKRGPKASMPSALEAGSILIATDTGEAYVDDSSTVRVQLKDSTKLPLTGGTVTGPINMGSNKVTSSAAPTANTDLTNKHYVDTQIVNVGTSTFKNVNVSTDTDDILLTQSNPTSTDVTLKVNHITALSSGTAGDTYGPTSDSSLNYGSSFNVPSVISDEYGHLTSIKNNVITLPAAPTSVAKLTTPRSIDGVNFDGSAAITHYGVCNVTNTNAEKPVSLPGFTLVQGARVAVKFVTGNIAAYPTLNINNTGAKDIYYKGSPIGAFEGDRVYEFIYNGTQYELVGVKNSEYLAGPGLVLFGNKFYHREVGTEGNYGQLTDDTLEFGGTFTVPQIVTNEFGHVSLAVNHTITLPQAPTFTISAGNAGVTASGTTVYHATHQARTLGPSAGDSPTFGQPFTVPNLKVDLFGHVTAGENVYIDMPEAYAQNEIADDYQGFRNIVIVPKGTDPNTVECLPGTIICVKE